MLNMQKRYWLAFFILVFIVELIGVQLKNELLQLIFKPLLVPALIGYLASQVNINTGLAKWVLPALLFSFIGDVLLLFQAGNELFFLFGLVAFLTAHIFYIFFFYRIKTTEQVKTNILLLLAGTAYYAVLIGWLFSHLGAMKVPVCVYGIFICTMFVLAMHLFFIKNRTAGIKIFSGALLFVVSDSVLAVNKFYRPFDAAAMIIMLTYGLAQFFIADGAVQYINERNKQQYVV